MAFLVLSGLSQECKVRMVLGQNVIAAIFLPTEDSLTPCHKISVIKSKRRFRWPYFQEPGVVGRHYQKELKVSNTVAFGPGVQPANAYSTTPWVYITGKRRGEVGSRCKEVGPYSVKLFSGEFIYRRAHLQQGFISFLFFCCRRRNALVVLP